MNYDVKIRIVCNKSKAKGNDFCNESKAKVRRICNKTKVTSFLGDFYDKRLF